MKSTEGDLLHHTKYAIPFTSDPDILPMNEQKKQYNDQQFVMDQYSGDFPPTLNVKSTTNKKIQDLQNFSNFHDPRNISVRSQGVGLKKTDRFDPYDAYLYKSGLMNLNGQKIQYKKQYLNVDSRWRKQEPSSSSEELMLLDPNPLSFFLNSNEMIISHPNHDFKENDRILLLNASGECITIRTKIQDKVLINIEDGDEYMRFNYPHNTSIPNLNTIILPSGKSIIKANDMVNIMKFQPSLLGGKSYFHNIAINFLNGVHDIYLEVISQNDSKSVVENYFYIKLPQTFVTDVNDQNEKTELIGSYNLQLLFTHIAGVSISSINANFPVDINHKQGFHIITSTTQNSYTVEIDTNALSTINNAGGTNINVARILDITEAYPNPNNYIISLEKTLYNVSAVRLVSAEIPNSQNVIIDFPPEIANNKLYWQNFDDGDHIYSISVTPGKYDPEVLISELEGKISEVDRINFTEDNANGSLIQSSRYNENHFIKVNININTDVVSFSSYRETVLSRPIVAVNPDISEHPSASDNINENYKLIIEHKNHGVSIGDEILIAQATNHLGIQSTYINGEHIITDILSKDTYEISLPRFPLSDSRQNTGGGTAVYIYTPILFRLRFDFPDTIGRMLGFRDVGKSNAITKYSSVVRNSDPYEFDVLTDGLGNPINISNNAIILSGEDYIYMVSNKFNTMTSVGPIKEAFAKIMLADIPGKSLFNTFVPTVKVFDEPLIELDEIDIQIVAPNGSLYDFNGLDHSFTLEITYIDKEPLKTNVSERIGEII